MLSLAVPLALVGGLHYFLWSMLNTTSTFGTLFSDGLGVYLALSTLTIPAGLLSLRTRNPRLGATLSWVGLMALGMFSSLFVLALLRATLLPALDWLGVPVVSWYEASAWGVVALAFLATAAGLFVARMSPAVVHIDIPINGLPAGLQGFRIAQITDIHIGPTIGQGYLQRIVNMVNALQADLVAITGDVVDGDVPTLQDLVAPLQHLKAREGVALVLGNHELYSGAPAWVLEYRRLGLKVLLNEHFIVHRDSATLAVAGVTDHSAGRFFADLACDPHAAIRGEGETADARLLLAHQPVTAPAGADAGYHLALHGHTHGGQWWPWNHFVRMQQPVVKGLHRFGSMWSYTSVGTGYWGPPKRHFRSEITLLTLRPAANNK
jgi:predicted MPP superfamily phosphohydrolase